ncbi:hypothetical protein LINPERPRIM_LOCUS1292 [Linum perenne]
MIRLLSTSKTIITGTGQTSAGGLFRDTNDRYLTTYNMNLGICSITQAELRVIVVGL